MKTALIINPKSAAGNTMKLWRDVKTQLQNRLSKFEVFMTEFPRHATEITQHLCEKKYERIIVMGGDGSLHEVVNGLFAENGKMIQPDIKIGLLNSGRGCDFARTLELSADSNQNINILVDSKTKVVDIGKVTFVTSDGPKIEYFLNSFSCLLGGDVCKRVSRSRSILPPSLMYFSASLAGLMTAKPIAAEIKVPNRDPIKGEFFNIFAMNGKFSGGGMQWTPRAKVDDGLLDVMLVSKMSKIKLGLSGSKVYEGTFDQVNGIEYFQAPTVSITLDKFYSMELDGEVSAGKDIKVELLSKSLNFIC